MLSHANTKNMLVAILRQPGKEIVKGLCEQPEAHSPIEFQKVQEQHKGYANTLEKIGFFTKIAPPDALFPDGCFTEDTYLILPEVVIRLNPGAPSRANE